MKLNFKALLLPRLPGSDSHIKSYNRPFDLSNHLLLHYTAVSRGGALHSQLWPGWMFFFNLNLFYFISVLRSLVEWVRVVKIMLRKLSPNFERGYLWGWGPFDRRQVFMTQPGA